MPVRVVAECNDATYDATAHGYLQIGAHRTGRIRTLSVSDVGLNPQKTTIRVSRSVVSATRAHARRHHRRYAYLRLFATATVHGTRAYPIRYQLRLRVRVP